MSCRIKNDPKNIERIQSIKLFLFDLDGTVYLDTSPISGAIDCINLLAEKGKEYLFVTNNSSRNGKEYADKLRKMGFPVSFHHVVTSGQIAGWYLEEKSPGATLYVVGTESLKKELSAFNVSVRDDTPEHVDYVLIGFDTELTYQKLRIAEKLLSDGAGFIATNPDLVCPIGNGRYIPDCGSICLLLENATRKQPVFMGKPHSKLIDYIRIHHPVSKQSMAVTGDRLYTDIALGHNAGIMSICTLTGESDLTAIEKSPCKPDLVIDSIAELLRYL